MPRFVAGTGGSRACARRGYANGLMAYVREVAVRTEQYWCPINTLEPSQLRISAITCFSITVTRLGIERSYRLCDM